jgi:hypothetical protein
MKQNRCNNRAALGVDDTARADQLAKGIVGKCLTYRRPNSKKAFKHSALRFLRWERKQPKPKPKFFNTGGRARTEKCAERQ